MVVHRIIDWLEKHPDALRGRVILIPSLNPTGLLSRSRFPAFDDQDPNRTWPDSKPAHLCPSGEESTTDAWHEVQKRVEGRTRPQNSAFEAIWEYITTTVKPDYHLDLHTYSTLSIPFIFLDRLMFDREKGDTEEAAQALWNTTHAFVQSIGLTVVMERPAHLYIKQKLHRSTSGTTFNKLRIPSCTIELGPMHCVPPASLSAGVSAVLNAMRFSGHLCLPESLAITEVPVLHFDKPHRYLVYPLCPVTGIADFLVPAGGKFQVGDALAVIRRMDGTLAGTAIAEMDGFVIGWVDGVAFHKDQPMCMVAVEDGNVPSVCAWQDLPPSSLQ